LFVLTASQTAEKAREDIGLKHGLLTYALVAEGIAEWKADPGNVGEIELGAWLQYAANRVPALEIETREQQSRSGKHPAQEGPSSPRQTPQFVPDPLGIREEVLLRLRTSATLP
jgi:hypothetical protein